MSTFNINKKSQNGFTLVELLVVIGILAALISGAIITLNPFAQIEKGYDAQRRQDLQQIKNALEIYYQDHTCYPGSIEFGSEWSEGNVVYMSKVPQDESCSQGGSCYQYLVDDSDICPQWHVVFARLSQSENLSPNCALISRSELCIPSGYDENWACAISGSVVCSVISSSTLN